MKIHKFAIHLGTLALALTMSFSISIPVKAAQWRPDNPVNKDNVSTWDCIYFGKYWQNDTNGDGVADENDDKEYIKWRVLSVDGDDAFLLADQNLDVQPYHTTYEEVLWKTCTLRSWLNGFDATINQKGIDYSTDNFMDQAFDEISQEAILLTNVKNVSPTNQITNDTDTEDYIYLLSMDEIMNPAYGFTQDNRFEPGEPVRHSSNTAYLANKPNMAEAGVPTFWWLRTQGKNLLYASFLRTYGFFSQNGINVDVSYIGVRPALHLDLTKTDCYFNAGTVSSDGTFTEPEVTQNTNETSDEPETIPGTSEASDEPEASPSTSEASDESVTTAVSQTQVLSIQIPTLAAQPLPESPTDETKDTLNEQITEPKTKKKSKKNTKNITVDNLCYKITSNNTVTWTGVKKSRKKVSVPSSIKVGKKKYRVTAVKPSTNKKNNAIESIYFKNKTISF